MNAEQIGFSFIEEHAREKAAEERARIEFEHRLAWRNCWGWSGPAVGAFCEVGLPIVEREDGRSIYAYMERCALIEERPDGRWLAEIRMGQVNGQPWPKDGVRLLLFLTEIWPPVRDILAERERVQHAVSVQNEWYSTTMNEGLDRRFPVSLDESHRPCVVDYLSCRRRGRREPHFFQVV